MKITLATLHLATAQQVFDQVVGHLRKQGKKSLGKHMVGDVCQYRGEGGTMCAAGCLIGDDEYIREYEGKTWGILVGSFGLTLEHLTLIKNLQTTHDHYDVSEWEGKFRILAHKHGLSY